MLYTTRTPSATAGAADMHGVILPEHRATGITPAVEKSAAGVLAHLRDAQVKNLTQTIEQLKARGVWVVGLASEGKTRYTDFDFNRSLAPVVGNEGKGISRLVREHCDALVQLSNPRAVTVTCDNNSVSVVVLPLGVQRLIRNPVES